MVSNGFLPWCAEANETWPGVCQSWVTTTFSNAAESLLITGTTSAPPLTGSVPPSTKQFCTSTTIRALFGVRLDGGGGEGAGRAAEADAGRRSAA